MAERILVMATRNRGKIHELNVLLSGFDVEIRSMEDFGPIPEPVEDGSTFEENAYKKAAHTARMLGFPALADDSGIVVESLGGAPGIHSARYAGVGATDEENNRKLLRELEGVVNRKAEFRCVIVIAVPQGPALTYEGSCEGEIALSLLGENGFGYDPLFYYPPLGKTFAQMDTEEKNEVSHRGRAFRELRSEFPKVLVWMKQRLED
ncbi:MAG: XTP/dITP diphosphatase [Desulfobacteraceae bacterium]|nr:MAG: XTP/dITP diphosphatase [Desulfobacteraceae bacterium]